MKNLLWLILVGVFGSNVVFPAEEEKATYYTQLIRGTDEEKSPAPGSKPIDAKLTKKLQAAWRWKHYWEINRTRVELAQGEKTKVRLSKEREVEIDLTIQGKRKVTVYSNGKPVSSAMRPLGHATTVIGGDRETNTVWFIVVRRDKPPD